MAAIDITDLRKSFGTVQILKGVDLSIASGEFVVLVGPSGCGKSTLLRLIAGLETATTGEIRIGGEPVDDLPPKDRDIAMVFQSYALYPHMTVRDNMSYSLRLQKSPREAILNAVAEAGAKLGLGALLERKPRQLSGGQRQRVAMGRAIVRRPRAFLFDEPLSNLDARLREQMRFEIKKLHRDFGATSVYVTHDQIEAMTMADRIVAMNEGIIQQVGTPLDLYDDPANIFVAGFIGSPAMNFLDARAVLSGTSVTIDIGGIALATLARPAGLADGAELIAGVRPERVALTSGEGIEALVDLVEPTGLGTVLHLLVGRQELKLFTTERPQVAVGTTAKLRILPEDVRLFDKATGMRVRVTGA
jgi:multiple sugar transport system ATP-binding protein